MIQDNIVEVKDLYKKFCRSLKRSLFYGASDVTKGMFGIKYNPNNLRKGEFYSLEGINFEVKRGEIFGLLGSNGSGKSTLLRVITGILAPDNGSVSVRGKIGALIAVGAGFHPHMSGRENVYLNGAILGMPKDEIDRKVDDIINFADLREFIDAPIATYSSGMSVRLGFSIAIHSNIEILIADEILAVGDINFQKKCFAKINELRNQGVTTIFVSHSLSVLERLCERGLLINNGKQIHYGTMSDCIKHYMKLMNRDVKNDNNPKSDLGVGNIEFTKVEVADNPDFENPQNVTFGKDIFVKTKLKIKKRDSDSYQLRITFRNNYGQEYQKFIVSEKIFPDGERFDNFIVRKFKDDDEIIIKINSPYFLPQTIIVDVAMLTFNHMVHEGAISDVTRFTITEPNNSKVYFEYGSFTVTQFDYEILN